MRRILVSGRGPKLEADELMLELSLAAEKGDLASTLR